MNQTPPETTCASGIACLFRSYPKRWLVPAIGIALAATLYAFLWPSTWQATQALIIRDEAVNNDRQLGQFRHADEMKTVQETILELVRSQTVLRATMETVGPPAGYAEVDSTWPTAEAIDDLRNRVELTPPKGAEFGQTEIFYLTVSAKTPDRARMLVATLTDQLEIRFQQLRDSTAQSMIDELVKAAAIAESDLNESTVRLNAIEREVGSDLAELRVLHDAASGHSVLRGSVTEIRNELREARIARKSNEELLALLGQAQKEPETLVAMPNRLFESQPAIRRLKDGLVDAQLRSADTDGRMSSKHPLVQAAKEAEQQIVSHLHNELATAIAGIEVDQRLNADRIATLEDQLAEVNGRLDRLAGLRADYSNLVTETRTRSDLLKQTEQRLSEARVSQATASATSLIGRIDAARADFNPVGPSRLLILLAGLVGGLAAGAGVLALTVTPEALLDRSIEPVAVDVCQETADVSPASGPATLTFKQALQKVSLHNG